MYKFPSSAELQTKCGIASMKDSIQKCVKHVQIVNYAKYVIMFAQKALLPLWSLNLVTVSNLYVSSTNSCRLPHTYASTHIHNVPGSW